MQFLRGLAISYVLRGERHTGRLNALTAEMARQLRDHPALPGRPLVPGVRHTARVFPAAVRWRDSGRPIPDGGGPVPTSAELDEE